MNNKKNGLLRNSLFYIVIFLGFMGMLYYFFGSKESTNSQQIQSSQFVTELRKDNVKDFTIQPSGSTYKITGTYRKAKKAKAPAGLAGLSAPSAKVTTFTTNVLTNDTVIKTIENYAAKNNVKNNTKEEESSSVWIQLLISLLPLVFIVIFFYIMMGQAGQGGRRQLPARRRLQAPHQPLLLPGAGHRGHPGPGEGPGGHRPAHCQRTDG